MRKEYTNPEFEVIEMEITEVVMASGPQVSFDQLDSEGFDW